jgi:outer membrane protein
MSHYAIIPAVGLEIDVGARGEIWLSMGMNNWLRKLVPSLLLLTLMSGTVWAQTRIATVDLRKVFDNYYKTKQADAALKERAADLDKEYKALRDDHKKTTEDYQKLRTEAGDQAVSTEERDKRNKAADGKLKDIKDLEDTIRQFETTAKANLDEQRRRMRDKVLEEIRTTISAKARTAGYAIVMDAAAETANATPIVVYSNGENDLTEGVLTQLNATAPAETAKPAEKKEDKKDDKKEKK